MLLLISIFPLNLLINLHFYLVLFSHFIFLFFTFCQLIICRTPPPLSYCCLLILICVNCKKKTDESTTRRQHSLLDMLNKMLAFKKYLLQSAFLSPKQRRIDGGGSLKTRPFLYWFSSSSYVQWQGTGQQQQVLLSCTH